MLLSVTVFAFSNEPIGYESFKLGMSFEDATNILTTDYSQSWSINYATSSGSDDLTKNTYVKTGYHLENLKSEKIRLYFTQGLAGLLSRIIVMKNFENQYSAIDEFKFIRDLLIKKYGKPKSKHSDENYMSAYWQIDKHQILKLNVDLGVSSNLLLEYNNKSLTIEELKYYEKEIKKIRDDILKSQSDRY